MCDQNMQKWMHVPEDTFLLQAASQHQTDIMYSMSNSQHSLRLSVNVWKYWWILKMMALSVCTSVMINASLNAFQQLLQPSIDDYFHLSAGTWHFSSCDGIWLRWFIKSDVKTHWSVTIVIYQWCECQNTLLCSCIIQIISNCFSKLLISFSALIAVLCPAKKSSQFIAPFLFCCMVGSHN